MNIQLSKAIRDNFVSPFSIVIYLLTTMILLPYRVEAQVVNWNKEFEYGFTKLQHGSWVEALLHLEKIVNALTSLNLEAETEGLVYFACGMCTQQMGDIKKSIQYNSKALEITEIPIELRILLLSSQLQNYSDLSLNNECDEIVNDMMKIYSSRKDINLADKIMTYYSAQSQFSKVIEFEKDIPNLIVPLSSTEIDKNSNTIQWNTIYMNLARSFVELKEFGKALSYYQKSLETVTEYNMKNLSVIYGSMSKAYYEIGDKTSALKYQKLCVESESSTESDDTLRNQDSKILIRKLAKSAGKETAAHKNRYSADSYLQLGTLYTENGLYKESIECFMKADSLYASINDSEYRAYVWVRLYNSYHVIGDKEQYDKLREKLLSIYENNVINNSEISLIVASQIGKFYEDSGDYENALKAYELSLKSSRTYYGEDSPKTFPICYELTSLCILIGNLKGALELMEYLKNICVSHPEKGEEYISYILLNCELLSKLGRIGEAIALLENDRTGTEKTDNIELKSLFYTTLGGLYAEIGEYEEALTLEKQSLSLCEKATGKESVGYAHTLLNLGEYYSLFGNYSEALHSTLKATEIIRAKYGTDHQEYYHCLSKLAGRYYPIDKGKSKELGMQCLLLSKSLFGENSIEYADDLIHSVELSLNPSHDDLESFRKALEIRRNLGRDFDRFYLSYLDWYSVLLFVKQDWQSLLITSEEILKCTKEFIYLNFLSLSSSQREILWNSVKQSLNGLESYAAHYSQYAVEHGDYSLVDGFGRIAYNARLTKKGVLLESNRNLENLITTSTNPVVSELYNRIGMLKQQLNNPKHNVHDIHSLKTQLHSMERDLIKEVAPHREFVDFLSIEWEDIQNVLMPGEVAIEFFSYPAQDRVQYGAVILSDSSAPLTIAIFCEDELDKFVKGGETLYDYNDPGLYRTIWATLETFSDVRNAHTIYFSADNILNTIAIENLMDQDGHRANDKRTLFRLSSTREIVSKHPSDITESSAILYGGLDYDAPLESLNRTFHHISSTVIPFKRKQHRYTRSSRGAYDYLPGTLDEINHISRLIKSSKPELRSGVNGSESSFIALNGDSPSIIHLATHGFFYEPDEIEDKLSEYPTKYSFLNITDLEKISPETQAMRGSGVLFSGANITLKGLSIPDSIPDGILTAEELSNLNLGKTELAVLSACETGLGTTTEEGVFGLQRGFKLAGVKSLLMSLWKVDDKATSQIMQYFYENISAGLSMSEALQNAQKKMRENPSTSQPYYWAGWILLDGIN